MGFPTSEVGYTSATTERGEHEVHDGRVVGLDLKNCVDVKGAHTSLLAVVSKPNFRGFLT
jgi:hypothetical protein